LLLFLITTTSYAQAVTNPYPKTITVTGSAEMEITPNEIYVQVDLKEYEKKGGVKVSIDKIKADFLTAAKSIGIADTAITITQYDGFNGNPWLRKKAKKDELYASITYNVKIKDSKQLDDLVSKLDDNATQNFFIQRTSHSQLAEFRKKLKIEAVKAAKEKAQYLASAVDEKIGVAVTINEPTEYYVPYYNMRVSNSMLKTESAPVANDVAAPDFKKIKLKYDVTVVFALI
ncbi:MAG TPA: SIMPL domain-containing protein, partial [Chitinophagaceae bacterium]|nr:SIMPL domain-containing protein [Chitinophagaceae bacterium]